jgi:beta-exotoxin I transport system permease protein
MELLLAQPVRRSQVVFAHLVVDLLTIPLLCLSLWGGTCLGTRLVGSFQVDEETLRQVPFHVPVDPAALVVDPAAFGPGLWNAAALLFAVSGYTLWISSRGRFRGRVLGVAVLVTILQFLVNVVGQLWDAAAALRPFSVFYYYQPQQIVLRHRWTVDPGSLWHVALPPVPAVAVLAAVGLVGYGLALWTFCRRDLPAPL